MSGVKREPARSGSGFVTGAAINADGGFAQH